MEMVEGWLSEWGTEWWKCFQKRWKILVRHSNALHDWWSLIRGYDTVMKIQTSACPAVRSTAEAQALLEVGRCSSFFVFFFLFRCSTPQAAFMGLFTRIGFQRSLSRAPLIYQSSLIPHPICSGRDTGLSRRTNRNLAVISQLRQFFLSAYSLPSFCSFIAPLLFLHIFTYNYGCALQMLPLFFPANRIAEENNSST